MAFNLSFDFAFLMSDCPHKDSPANQGGLYAVYDIANRDLVYIGMTTSFRRRLIAYQSENAFADYSRGVIFGFAPVLRPTAAQNTSTDADAAYEALLRGIEGSILSCFNPLPAENTHRPNERVDQDIAIRGGYAWDSLLFFPASGCGIQGSELSEIQIPKRR